MIESYCTEKTYFCWFESEPVEELFFLQQQNKISNKKTRFRIFISHKGREKANVKVIGMLNVIYWLFGFLN
jgi:hypothetical protein